MLFWFSLIVVDSEGLSDTATATVRVSSPKDEPPMAIAGTDQVIKLPLNHLTLWANQSTDDHAISSYLWSLHPSSLTKSVTIQVKNHELHMCIAHPLFKYIVINLLAFNNNGLYKKKRSQHPSKNPHTVQHNEKATKNYSAVEKNVAVEKIVARGRQST